MSLRRSLPLICNCINLVTNSERELAQLRTGLSSSCPPKPQIKIYEEPVQLKDEAVQHKERPDPSSMQAAVINEEAGLTESPLPQMQNSFLDKFLDKSASNDSMENSRT
jgi:hypothetical protein